MSLTDDIRQQFRTGNVLMQLIYINAGVYLLLQVSTAIFWLFGSASPMEMVYHWLSLPALPQLLLTRPWSLLSHMFLHRDFFHILFNLMWLYFAGTLFLNFLSQRQLLSTYLLGGLSGAVAFVLAMNLIPAFGGAGLGTVAMGSSAAVSAVLVAVAALRPDHTVHLVLIGGVRLKYLAMVMVVLDVIMLPYNNGGGSVGHLGGALFGMVYGMQLRNGSDFSLNFLGWINRLKSLVSKGRSSIKVVHRKAKTDDEYNADRNIRQHEVDALLDKIKQRGYDSLSAKEKELLFKASKNV